MNAYKKRFEIRTRASRGHGRPVWGKDRNGKPTYKRRFQWAGYVYIGSHAGTVWTLGSKRIAGRTITLAINCKKAAPMNRMYLPYRFIQLKITRNAQMVPFVDYP